jgi:hypothetical protein
VPCLAGHNSGCNFKAGGVIACSGAVHVVLAWVGSSISVLSPTHAQPPVRAA